MFSLGVLKWPVDVLLYTLSFCNLEDSISFSMVCKDMYTLAAQKAFWITALKNERRIKPIACPYHEDITMHDVHSLRRIALHTQRLERNWDSANPQVLGQIKTVSLGFPTLEILFQVPGTELYVLHCHIRGIVELWHIGLGRTVSGPFQISTDVCDISQGEDLPGRLTMALLVRKEDAEDSYQIALVCVEYGPSDVFTLTVSLLCSLPVGSQAFYWAVFLDHDIVGALCYSDDAERLCVWALNRTTGKDGLIVTDLPNAHVEISLEDDQIFQSGTTIVDGNLCILIAGSWVFTVPNSHLPRDDNPDCPSVSIFRFEGNFSHFSQQPRGNDNISFLTVVTANSPYGVSAMTVNVVSPVANPHVQSALEMTFWIRPESTGEDKHPLTPLTSDSMPGFFADEVDSSRWERLVQTLSGRRGLVLSNVKDEADENDRGTQTLRLISCERDKAQATYRDLVLPDFIDLFSVQGLYLDDHLGVVSVTDTTGVLYTIPYA